MEESRQAPLMPMLYLCTTPIGNMEDITLRVIRTLEGVSCIFCEDTRHTLALLNKLNIKKPLYACHEHNENEASEEVIRRVQAGEAVAFVSDAGMPGISDPGERLAAACIRTDTPFTVLPGASASLTALVLSGFPSKGACFFGFLPRDTKPRREAIASAAGHKGTLIFYESPLRVAATCKDLSEMLGDRPAALVRELTKIYEECVRGTLSSLAERYRDVPPKGECVLIVNGAEDAPAATEDDIKNRLVQLLAKGIRAKDAAKEVSAVLGVSRNEAYKLAVELQNQ